FLQAEDDIRDRNVTGVQTCALPISLELLPGRRNGARLVELRPSHVKHAVVAHSIEGLLDPLSGGLACSEDEVIGLELVRDHRDLLALTVAEMHMSRLRVSERVKVARRLVDVEDDPKARRVYELVQFIGQS